jgi:acyl-CoA synthetase (AMP-forming)/AMP-acid ligase II
MGQVPELLVVMEPDADFSSKTIIRSLAASLEPYKIPQVVRKADTINRTFNGKPDRLSYKNA